MYGDAGTRSCRNAGGHRTAGMESSSRPSTPMPPARQRRAYAFSLRPGRGPRRPLTPRRLYFTRGADPELLTAPRRRQGDVPPCHATGSTPGYGREGETERWRDGETEGSGRSGKHEFPRICTITRNELHREPRGHREREKKILNSHRCAACAPLRLSRAAHSWNS